MVQSEARGKEGKGGEAGRGSIALHYCCAIAFLEVSAFQQLPHGVNTPQYEVGMDSNSMAFILSFVKTVQLVTHTHNTEFS
jgi:hypothetical protein